jgi:hypothetical protein
VFLLAPSAGLRLEKARQYLPTPSKYPPAKPGALECEPLKAAGKAAYAAYTLINSQGLGSRVNSLSDALAQLYPWTKQVCFTSLV